MVAAMEPKESLLKTAIKDPVVRIAALGGAGAGGVLVVAVFALFGDHITAKPPVPAAAQSPFVATVPAPVPPVETPRAVVETLPADGKFRVLGTVQPDTDEMTDVIVPPREPEPPTKTAPGLAQAPQKPHIAMTDLPPEPEATPPPAPKTYPDVKQPVQTAAHPPASSPLPPEHLQSGKPKIAIVIDDMGVDRKRSARAMELPGKVTLSFLPYASDLAHQTGIAKAKGHELMLHVAMEPESTEVDPGPNVLLTGVPPKELQANLNWNMAQMADYIGVNNHMGSRFTRDLAGMRLVMAALKDRGLFFLDSLTSRDSVAAIAAAEAGVPYTRRHIFIDHKDDAAFIARQIAQIEDLAKKQGYAVAIGHPRELTLDALEKWLPGLAEKGFELIGVSGLFKDMEKSLVGGDESG